MTDDIDRLWARLPGALEFADRVTSSRRPRFRTLSADGEREMVQTMYCLASAVRVLMATVEAQGDCIEDARRRADEGMGVCGDATAVP